MTLGAIGVVLVSLYFLAILIAAAVSKKVDKIDERTLEAEKAAIEQLDKVLETKDDLNEPARWVP
jgi:hypothetical protein